MSTQPRIHGRYRVDERLGATRIATVYRAYDDKLNRPVLLNLMRSHLAEQRGIRDRFVSDSELRARNVHSALPEVYDSGNIEDRPFFITEFITGRTVRTRAPFTPQESLTYIKHIVAAVNACYQSNIPHPPISSNDFVVVSEGHVKWIENWQLSPSEVLIDLASYRAPERKDNDNETPQSAVFAIGVLLFEMLTGMRPFVGTTPEEITQKINTIDIPPVTTVLGSTCPPQVDELIMRCTVRNPEYRIQDFEELLILIEQTRRVLLVESGRLSKPLGNTHDDDTNSLYEDDTTVIRTPWLKQLMSVMVTAVIVVAIAVGGWFAWPYIEESVGPIDTQAIVAQISAPFQQLSLDSFVMPPWLTNLFQGSEPAQMLVVSGDGMLDVYSDPTSSSQVIGQIAAGSQVEWLDGPQSADGQAWLRIRYQSDQGTIDGWAQQQRLVVATP
ncbi:MAG: protein kinase domain-containing protein [Chloroflexota bacterium]|jgi:serine/threonine protein kinase